MCMNSNSSEISELQIIAFCGGSNEAITSIYKKWTPEFFLIAYRYLRNKEDAEDMVANVFEKLLNMSIERRKKKLLDDNINLKALLIVVLKNKCLDELKTKKNRLRILNNMQVFFGSTSANSIWETYSNEVVETLIAVLPDKERQIFKLKLDGFDRKEIGAHMNLSVKSVSNSLSKSKTKLKDLLADFI